MYSHIVGFVMRWFKWFFDRVSLLLKDLISDFYLQNKYSHVYRKTTCTQKDFTCNQKPKWRRRIPVQIELFMGVCMFIHKK